MHFTAFALIGLALGAFLVSTKQWPAPARFALIALGAGICILTAISSANISRIDLNSFREGMSGERPLLKVLANDWIGVAGATIPLFDLFLFLTLAVGAIALWSVTPGQVAERVARTMIVALLGAMIGAFLTLIFLAAGLAGYSKHRAYVGILGDPKIVDGDTIKIGEVSIRLFGVDAPEHTQMCVSQTKGLEPCGQEAQERLFKAISQKLVICDSPTAKGSYERFVMSCRMYQDGTETDLAEFLKSAGLAVSADARGNASKTPQWKKCTLQPRVWRREKSLRDAFLEKRFEEIPIGRTIGPCEGLGFKERT